MVKPTSGIVLVTPVWNDSQRLAAFAPDLLQAIRASGLPITLVVADDGSSDEERGRLSTLVQELAEVYPQVELLSLSRRSHKGGAVYQAWDSYPEASWLAFVDADGAISGDSVIELIRVAQERGESGAAIAVRGLPEYGTNQRPAVRSGAFHAFRFCVRWLTGIRYQDTQCGAKVIPGTLYRAVADQLCERGFIFDVELLLALEQAGTHIVEVGVPWQEMPNGKVHPFRDAWPMFMALLRIRKRLRSGHYSAL